MHTQNTHMYNSIHTCNAINIQNVCYTEEHTNTQIVIVT